MIKNTIMQNRPKALLWILSVMTFLVFSAGKCSNEKSPTNTDAPVAMEDVTERKTPIEYEFSGDYKEQWETIDSLDKKGLYRSSLSIVLDIYQLAKSKDNYPQVIKALMHKMRYNSFLEEDDYILAVFEMDSIANIAEFPLKQIAHALTADIYWGYYQSNQWSIMDRTATENFENKDIRTWDLRAIAQRVVYHRNQSISSSDRLKRVPLSEFKDILDYNNNTNFSFDDYRPTLFDFLAFESIRFFQTESYNISQADDGYQLIDEKLYAANIDFINYSHKRADTLSNHYYAIDLFKKLTEFHLADEDPSVLIEITLNRLSFLKNYASVENNNQKYLESLHQLALQFPSHDANAEVYYQIANWHYNNNNAESKDDEKARLGFKTAHEICEQTISKYPLSHGAKQCKALKNQIEKKSIDLTFEKNIAPSIHHKFLLQFRNVDTLYFKLFRLPNALYNRPYEHILVEGQEVSSWIQPIPNAGDFNQHSLEVLLAPLSYGSYAIVAGTDQNFSIQKNTVNHGFFQVTDFALEELEARENEVEYTVLNRVTGKPITGVTIQLHTRKYDSKKGMYVYKKHTSLTTNSSGKASYTSSKNISLYPVLSKDKDFYFEHNGIYLNNHSYHHNSNQTTTHYFLDRKIYRPGQTIYFKGIVIRRANEKLSIVPNSKITVRLYDANHQEVGKKIVTTNDYGSYNGQFTAPVGGLNGSMRIQDDHSAVYFTVEEYKRPKFQVEFDPIEGSYKLGEKINVSGFAQAFAGNRIDGAAIQYRVTRTARFPYWCWYKWGFMPSSNEYEVKSGDLTTDENGAFAIDFMAKEDGSVHLKYAPIYNYRISCDITDINGETRSGQTHVYVGKNAMELSLGIGTDVEKSKFDGMGIATRNLSGEKVNATGNVTITLLKTPDNSFKSPSWSVPDIKTFSKAEYRKYFPNDVYEKENKVENFEIDHVVLAMSFDTEKSDSIVFRNPKFATGHYKIEAKSVDAFGEEVTDIKFITVFDAKNKKATSNQMLWVKQLKNTYQPGDNAILLLSSAEDIQVKYTIQKEGKTVHEELIQIDDQQKRISIPIAEKDRGGFSVRFATVRHERNIVVNKNITVPFTNKQLKVAFETFRNKLLPGEEEEWKIKISGPKGEKVAAEMVAAMYDASLDEFASNSFNMYLDYGSSKYYNLPRYSYKAFGNANDSQRQEKWNAYVSYPNRQYPSINWFGFYPSYSVGRPGVHTGFRGDNVLYFANESIVEEDESIGDNHFSRAQPMLVNGSTMMNKSKEEFQYQRGKSNRQGAGAGLSDGKNGKDDNESSPKVDLSNVKARNNFNETAFFLPHLETNEKGEIIFSFKIPESLTEWKFLSFAHTKDLKKGGMTESVITQKDLMVVPNAPRFFREGDKIVLSSKISNLSEESLTGQIQLFLFDALTNAPIDTELKNSTAQQTFTTESKKSTSVQWSIEIPLGIQAITYKIVAKANDFSDGEEMTLPVLSNRMLVTESLPLPIRKKGTKTFTLKKLVNTTSTTLTHHNLTLEFTSNPAWYAIQALPYMMEYPHECAEQTFSRYYANSIATHVANSNPKIEKVFESWKEAGKEAFLSNLEKNQELKSLFLEETPWVMNAQSESENKKRVGLLFDLHRMKKEMKRTLKKIEQMQSSNGGWAWFPGMKESRYITQHIITGMGHLNKLKIISSTIHLREWKMIKKGMNYLDTKVIEDFRWLKKNHPDTYLKDKHLSNIQIQWLYARSFFTIKVPKELEEAYNYYLDQCKKYWLDNNLYTQAMIALALDRLDKDGTVQDDVMKSLSELAIHDEEMGMYYKKNRGGYYWYNAPIETQALLIEAFDEVANNLEAVDELKVWLLKQKQTTHWKTTKATAEACYSLLLRGTDILANDEIVGVSLGGTPVVPPSTEAGTGYFKTSWTKDQIQPEMGNVSVTKQADGVAWGALYWQYFEDLDKITPHDTPLQITKKLFKVQLNKNGEYMAPIEDENSIGVGDKVRVRIEIHTDRDLEYVHLKDMRAAGFEPTNVFSQYKWQDGLGYYESTKDASTNFFMDRLGKGSYVFEYDLRVSHEGDFSNGITTIQCMYAPEFTSHSEGIRVLVK